MVTMQLSESYGNDFGKKRNECKIWVWRGMAAEAAGLGMKGWAWGSTWNYKGFGCRDDCWVAGQGLHG